MKYALAVGMIAMSAITGNGLLMVGALLTSAVSAAAYRASTSTRNARVGEQRKQVHAAQERADEAIARLAEAHAKAAAVRQDLHRRAAILAPEARKSPGKLEEYTRLYDAHEEALRAERMASQLLAAAKGRGEEFARVLRRMPEVQDLDGEMHKVKTAGIAAATVLFPALVLYAAADLVRPRS